MILCVVTGVVYIWPISQESFAQNKNLSTDKSITQYDKINIKSLSSAVELTLLNQTEQEIVLEIKNNSKKKLPRINLCLAMSLKFSLTVLFPVFI